MICRNCGNAMEGAPKFCPFCGSPVEQAAAQEPIFETRPVYDTLADSWDDLDGGLEQAAPVTTKKKSKLPLIIGIAVILLALVIGLFACGGSGKDPIVGEWEGIKFLADDMELDESIRGEFSMVFNNDGTCKLIMPNLGDTPEMVYKYDTDMTDGYNATKTDGSKVRIYAVAFATNPDVVMYYAMLTDSGMGMLSTDSFSTSYSYQLIFRAS